MWYHFHHVPPTIWVFRPLFEGMYLLVWTKSNLGIPRCKVDGSVPHIQPVDLRIQGYLAHKKHSPRRDLQ